MGDNKYTHRFLARFILEAETPLAVGSGERNTMTDRMVATDVNGLPYIPGTALAGVLRNSVILKSKDELFGFQKGDDGQGSRLILSSAQMIGEDGSVIDGISTINFSNSFYAGFQNLPVRQHVRISHKGAAEQGGKFDEQVVYKGTRFCFEMELVGNESDNADWEKLIAEFSNPSFRVGGGTRKGFGSVKVVELRRKVLDLSSGPDLETYLEKTSGLNDVFWVNLEAELPGEAESNWTQYHLTLTPDDFFLFGSGFGSEDGNADITYVTEKVIEWTDGRGTFMNEKVFVPAASVKGALAHRTAFHFNKECGVYADKLKDASSINDLCRHGYYDFRNSPGDVFDSNKYEDRLKLVTTYNPAVRVLFGFALDDKDETGAQRGNVLFSDVFLSDKDNSRHKLLNHVAIDRFTGGAMDGALFSEEVTSLKEQFSLRILVNPEVNRAYLQAFEKALDDLCTGMLPLGGGTMRGHGCFSGRLLKNGE